MISGLIPHRYAMALYKYARETGSQQPIYEAMKTVLAAYSYHACPSVMLPKQT